MNFYVWTKKKAPNLYQLGANDNEKETLIDCTSASAVFFYQIKSFVSILEDESARFFAVSKSNSNADRNRGKTGVFLGEFIVDKPVAINNIVEEIRKFAINKRNWTIKNNVLCCLRRECLPSALWGRGLRFCWKIPWIGRRSAIFLHWRLQQDYLYGRMCLWNGQFMTLSMQPNK